MKFGPPSPGASPPGAAATATLDGISISGSGYSNQSQSSLGGVIYVEGMVQIENSTFSANSGGLGGVIHAQGGTVSVSNSTFSSNSALNGGVIYARDGSFITSINNTFQNNVATGFGGGLLSFVWRGFDRGRIDI